MKKSYALLAAMILAIFAESNQVHSQDYTEGPYLKVDGEYVRWGHPSKETVTITYTYAQSVAEFGDGIARNCLHTLPFFEMLRRSKIEFAAFHERVVQALKSWEAVANVRFVYTEHDSEADVRIAAQAQPDRIAYVNLSLHPPNGDGYRQIKKAIICLNPQLPWSLVFSNKQSEPSIDSVMQHEAGHVIGLDHLGKNGFRMSYLYSGLTTFGKLDILAAQSLYGKKRE